CWVIGNFALALDEHTGPGRHATAAGKQLRLVLHRRIERVILGVVSWCHCTPPVEKRCTTGEAGRGLGLLRLPGRAVTPPPQWYTLRVIILFRRLVVRPSVLY